MKNQVKWVRREFTSRGPDPTVIVEWTATVNETMVFTLQEFQGVVVRKHASEGIIRNLPNYAFILENELHQALEALHTLEQNACGTPDEDVEAAERAAGWDPNP